MDNKRLDVISEGVSDLTRALQIAWGSFSATHYKVMKLKEDTQYFAYGKDSVCNRHVTSLKEDPNGIPTLILLWSNENDATALPFKLSQLNVTDFVQGWLNDVEYGREPDHDGNNGKGWRVFTEQWGYVAGHQYSIVGIQPAWAMYGK